MMILLGGEVIIKHSRVADARDRRKKRVLRFFLLFFLFSTKAFLYGVSISRTPKIALVLLKDSELRNL